MSTTTIPADAALLLRRALYGQLGDVAEELASARRQPQADPAQVAEWHEPVARFDRTRALLDVIGWSDRDPEQDVGIDLDAHRQVIEQALSDELASEHHLMSERGDAAAGQRERARGRAQALEAFAQSTGLALAETRETRVITTIPADFRPLLLECLLEALRDAAEAIEQCGLHAESYPEPLEHFDSIRAALDAIGWGVNAEIDVDVHRDALQQALSGRLTTERHMQATAEAAPAGDEDGRQRAYRYVLEIETWATSAGLVIPEAGERDA